MSTSLTRCLSSYHYFSSSTFSTPFQCHSLSFYFSSSSISCLLFPLIFIFCPSFSFFHFFLFLLFLLLPQIHTTTSSSLSSHSVSLHSYSVAYDPYPKFSFLTQSSLSHPPPFLAPSAPYLPERFQTSWKSLSSST